MIGPGRPSAGGPRMDRRGVTSPRVVKVSHLASRLRRSARRGPQLSIFFSQNFTGLGEALWGLRGSFQDSVNGPQQALRGSVRLSKVLWGLAKLYWAWQSFRGLGVA